MSRIVIAEDDEVVVELVREAFAGTPHIVGWLPDGESALKVMRQRPPDLAILDCNMPGMSGIKVLREMRQSPDLCHVPVLMLTGRQSDQDEQISRYEGANGYIRKPFQPDILVQRAEVLLGGSELRTWMQ